MRIEVVTLYFLTWCLIKGYASENVDYESQLRSDLLSKLPSDIESRPMPTKNTTNLEVFLIVTHIMGLDEKTEILSLNGWMFFLWDDERLQWDPAKYGGITNLRISETVVWKPNLVLYNSAAFSEMNQMRSVARPIVSYGGWVRWVPAFTSKSICAMDFKWFPFDEHNCSLNFGSWYESGNEVNITLNPYSVRNLIVDFGDTHNEWELSGTNGERTVSNPGTDYEWHVVKFYLVLRRTAPYYQITLVVPSVTAILLTLAIFLIPVSCPALKYTLASFNIILLTILVLHVYWVVPRSGSAIPGILVLIGNTLALAGVSLLFSAIISYVSQRYEHPVPHLIQKHMNGPLAVALCLRLPQTSDAEHISTSSQETQVESSQMQVGDPWNGNAKKKLNASQWMTLATAIDRICFAVYVFTFFIILIVAFT